MEGTDLMVEMLRRYLYTVKPATATKNFRNRRNLRFWWWVARTMRNYFSHPSRSTTVVLVVVVGLVALILSLRVDS